VVYSLSMNAGVAHIMPGGRAGVLLGVFQMESIRADEAERPARSNIRSNIGSNIEIGDF